MMYFYFAFLMSLAGFNMNSESKPQFNPATSQSDVYEVDHSAAIYASMKDDHNGQSQGGK